MDRAPGREFYVVNMSGGKDSTALALWMREQGLPHIRVFADTGWEHPDTYAYLRYLSDLLGEIVTVRAARQFEQRTRESKSWPARSRRWCTRELKVYPIAKWMKAFEPPDGFSDVVTCVGVRAEESATRAKFPEREWSDDNDGWIWRPLLRWTLADVIECHHRNGVRLNPLYLRGFERVGCYPCIFSGKTEVRLIAEQTPERIDLIREIEAETGNTMFALRASERVDPKGTHIPTPIDAMVSWAKTSHGGSQMLLIAPDSGCARWGLCEPPPVRPAGEE